MEKNIKEAKIATMRAKKSVERATRKFEIALMRMNAKAEIVRIMLQEEVIRGIKRTIQCAIANFIEEEKKAAEINAKIMAVKKELATVAILKKELVKARTKAIFARMEEREIRIKAKAKRQRLRALFESLENTSNEVKKISSTPKKISSIHLIITNIYQ